MPSVHIVWSAWSRPDPGVPGPPHLGAGAGRCAIRWRRSPSSSPPPTTSSPTPSPEPPPSPPASSSSACSPAAPPTPVGAAGGRSLARGCDPSAVALPQRPGPPKGRARPASHRIRLQQRGALSDAAVIINVGGRHPRVPRLAPRLTARPLGGVLPCRSVDGLVSDGGLIVLPVRRRSAGAEPGGEDSQAPRRPAGRAPPSGRRSAPLPRGEVEGEGDQCDAQRGAQAPGHVDQAAAGAGRSRPGWRP